MQVQARQTTTATQAGQALMAALLKEPGARCGWFDSSFELSQGLVISEEADETVLALWCQQGGAALH
ncbi:hypothetical protein PEC18_28500 [Paucibacter sp. O1-1]|nr:hypothetical protein [Paucibacter sp. O1-1]MDA3829680.1 hypothetical protein [Paucibacter sp. O1-1]